MALGWDRGRQEMQEAKQRQAEFQEGHDKVVRVSHLRARLNGLLGSEYHRPAHLHLDPEGGIVEHGTTADKAGSPLVSTLLPCCTPPNAAPEALRHERVRGLPEHLAFRQYHLAAITA